MRKVLSSLRQGFGKLLSKGFSPELHMSITLDEGIHIRGRLEKSFEAKLPALPSTKRRHFVSFDVSFQGDAFPGGVEPCVRCSRSAYDLLEEQGTLFDQKFPVEFIHRGTYMTGTAVVSKEPTALVA